jgi:transposase
LIETSKLNGIDPQVYLADILTRVANGHPINRLDELRPWSWSAIAWITGPPSCGPAR